MKFRVFVKAAKFLPVPDGYTAENYFGDNFEQVGPVYKTKAGACARLADTIKRRIYGFFQEGERSWTIDRDAYIDRSVH